MLVLGTKEPPHDAATVAVGTSLAVILVLRAEYHTLCRVEGYFAGASGRHSIVVHADDRLPRKASGSVAHDFWTLGQRLAYRHVPDSPLGSFTSDLYPDQAHINLVDLA